MGAAGSRILLRPSDLNRGVRLQHDVPGHGCLPRFGPPDGSRLMPISRSGIQIEDTSGIRIVPAGFPPLALCMVTGNQLRRGDDGPVRHARRTGMPASRQPGRPCRRQMRTFPGRSRRCINMMRDGSWGLRRPRGPLRTEASITAHGAADMGAQCYTDEHL